MDTLSDLCSIEDNLFRGIFSSDKRSSSREFAIRSSVEGVVKDLVDMVEEGNTHYVPPVARILFADDDRAPRELFDFVDSRRDSRYCSCCGQHEWTILERIRKENGDPGDLLEDREGILVCLSCSEMLEIRGQDTNVVAEILEEPCWTCCSNCFLSEKMGARYGIDMEVVRPDSGEDVNVCSVCLDIFPDLGYEEYDTEEEEYDTEEETYEGEYENEELPENNGEIQKEIKESIQDMGEVLFDIRDKVSEGEYLKLMDLLQKVTNNVNRL